MTNRPHALLKVDNLSLGFGGLEVLHDIALELRAGEVLGLIGPNGAGKSALFNCISGLYRPHPGSRIAFEGAQISGIASHNIARLGIKRTFQHVHLLNDLTVLENVLLGAAHQFRGGVLRRSFMPWASAAEERSIRRKALKSLDECGILDYAEKSVRSLPLGLRRRVDLARALVTRPRLLLLDEPASGLSDEERTLVRDLVQIALHDNKVAVMWIEHDLDLVISAATRVIVLHHGRIVAEGEPHDSAAERTRLIDAYLAGGANAR